MDSAEPVGRISEVLNGGLISVMATVFFGLVLAAFGVSKEFFERWKTRLAVAVIGLAIAAAPILVFIFRR